MPGPRRALDMFRVNPTVRLALCPCERVSRSMALPANLASPDCFPCLGKPHGHAPTVGQLVLRGALAKNNPVDVRSPENLLQTSPQTAAKTFQGKAGHSSLTHWFGPCASIITCVTERGLQS